MIVQILVCLALFASLAWAEAPTTAPTTSPSAPLLAEEFPTPAELVEKFKALRQKRASRTKVAYLDLDSALREKPSEFSILGGDDTSTLRVLLDRLGKARQDKDVRAVLVTVSAGAGMNLAQAQEIRDALVALRRAGKKTFVYADSYDTTGYLVASGATDVCMLEGGQIMIPGIGIETMFYKGTLDKIGVFADYVQVGEFKGAEEPYTRTAASEELAGELTRLVDAMYEQIVDGVSKGRNISRQAVKQLIDETMLAGTSARERGLVDHLLDADGLRALIKDEVGNEINLVHNYGEAEKTELDLSNPFMLLAQLARKPETSDKPAVAIIYAEGVITDGDGEGGLFEDGGVGSDAMRKAFRIALRDDQIKAIVLRIDSPGGSALASEVMWQALRRVAEKKPVIVSIGSMAASGGYYLASAGDHIFADPCAIVGSIGVVGGKFVLKDLFEKIGLTTEIYAKGRNADLFSSNEKFTDRQKRMIRNWMQTTYDQFTARVLATRRGKIQDIDKVARGRIFLAHQALELGMVDELGGLDAAIAHAADRAGLREDSFDVRVVPAPKTLADLIFGSSDDSTEEARNPFHARSAAGMNTFLELLPSKARGIVRRQLQLAHLLEKRPVVLIAPFSVNVR